jgi:hypothetical protein
MSGAENLRFLQQKVVSELSRATRLRKEKSGDQVSPFSKIASAWFDVGTAELEQPGWPALSGGSDG